MSGGMRNGCDVILFCSDQSKTDVICKCRAQEHLNKPVKRVEKHKKTKGVTVACRCDQKAKASALSTHSVLCGAHLLAKLKPPSSS